MKQEVFDHWMKFAIWATPLLVIITFFVRGAGNNGLGIEGAVGGGFDAMILFIFYGLYTGVSLWRIIRIYLQTKHL